MIAVGLILCTVAYAIEYFFPNIVFTSNVALLTVGTPIFWLGVFIGEDASEGALSVAMLFTAATLGCVYLFDPRFIGTTPLLGFATTASWLTLVLATAGSDALDTGDPLNSAFSASSSASWLSLIIGVAYLAATAQLDRQNLRAVGTGFAVSGLCAFASGTTGVVTDIEAGGAAKALMIIAAGCWLIRVGHMGGRRVTAWAGALGVFIGCLVFLFDVANGLQGSGVIALVAAIIVAAVALNLGKIAALLRVPSFRTVDKPEPTPSHVPTPQVDAVPVAQDEPTAREPEIVESPEVVEPSEVAEESPARRAGPKEKKDPMVDDDPELVRLQKALAAAEQKIEQRLEDQRRAEQAENRKAETTKRISELASRLEEAETKLTELEAEAKLTDLDALGSLETTKALQKRCRCKTLVDVSSPSCPNCMTKSFLQSAAVWRCQRCEHVVGEHDDSCGNCRAVFQE